jgi:CRISPR-associated protein Cas2
MDKQFLLIVYDISNDKRRTKLHNALLDFGTPVQYSVFEVHADAKDLERLKKAVKKIIRPKKDNVRYYFLCAACEQKIEASHGDVVSEAPKAWVV